MTWNSKENAEGAFVHTIFVEIIVFSNTSLTIVKKKIFTYTK